MSGWQAIVPLNLGRACKTRLAGLLTGEERERLVAAMARHVVGRVRSVPSVTEVRVLSPDRPDLLHVAWLPDLGRGLNAELAAAFARGRTLVIHGDLPLLAGDEVADLIAAAERAGAALAPDRAGVGTNALALAEARAFTPAFGHRSLARHFELLPHAARIDRPGLALDLDTPDDLALARRAGAVCIAGPI